MSSTSVKALVELIVQERFQPHPPFKGTKPFVVVASDDDRPRALVTDELLIDQATEYVVALTCDERREANRFAYQYAHELAHFWFTPVEHPFLEVCAVAVSLSVLRECGKLWKPKRCEPSSYGEKFEQYRQAVERNSRQILGRHEAQPELHKYLPRNSVAAQSTTVGDEHILAGELLSSRILDQYSSWKPLLTLHRFLCVELVDFDLWITCLRTSGDSMDVKFAQDISNCYASVFGVMPRKMCNRFCVCS